jgi:hypothetical protein
VLCRGAHITLPSVLLETKRWVKEQGIRYDFVDPEIGHFAVAAERSSIRFSYLHLISDNLVRRYSEDLSNEREEIILGKQCYKRRAGVEATLSQGVRGFGLRYARYRALTKTHCQHVATAAAINVDQIMAWLDERPRAKTRTSHFAALAPACGMR